MARPVRPVFLAPSSYRQKRLRDAARLLPLLGFALLLVPLLWTRSGEPGGVGNSDALLFVLAVWAVLVGLAFLLSRLIRPSATPEEAEPEEGGP